MDLGVQMLLILALVTTHLTSSIISIHNYYSLVPAIQCSSESYNNANWTTTQTGQIASGTCLTNYTGSPTRQCNLNGTKGSWSSNVTNPCTGNVLLLGLFLFFCSPSLFQLFFFLF